MNRQRRNAAPRWSAHERWRARERLAGMDSRADPIEDTRPVLGYFDTVNFADRIRCPTLLALDLQDDVVPAKTVYGIANHLPGPCELMEFAVSHSGGPEDAQWPRIDERWLQLARHGVPPDLGRDVAGGARPAPTQA